MQQQQPIGGAGTGGHAGPNAAAAAPAPGGGTGAAPPPPAAADAGTGTPTNGMKKRIATKARAIKNDPAATEKDKKVAKQIMVGVVSKKGIAYDMAKEFSELSSQEVYDDIADCLPDED